MTISPPQNLDDVRYLTEYAFKFIITQLSGFTVFITSDREKHTHPCVLVRVTNQSEDIAPGTGIFKQRVELELQLKLDQNDAVSADQAIRSLRQCLYRNDNDPRPMKDLAIRLSQAVPTNYTCFGVVPIDEAPPSPDPEIRLNIFRFAFDVRACANR